MTQVTGPLFDEGGNLLANTTCVVQAVDAIIGQDGGGRAKRGVVVVTDGSGVFDAELKPGRHILFVFVPSAGSASVTAKEQARLKVLSDATQTLQSALDTDVGEITASTLQLAQAAAEAALLDAGRAEDAATRAETAAAGVEFPVSYVEQTLDAGQQAQARENIGVDDVSLSSSIGPKIEMIAHRGFRQVYVQNTLPALTSCFTQGADAVEFDVHVSSDGVPVVFHDGSVDTLTDGSGDIRSLSAATIAGLSYTQAAGTQFAGVGIPTLEAVLSAVAERKFTKIYPEIKNSTSDAYIHAAVDVVKNFGLSRRCVWQSFTYADLAVIRTRDPISGVGFLVSGGRTQAQLEGFVDNLAGDFTNCYLLSSFSNVLNHPSIVDYARQAGVGLGVWTVNNMDDFRALLRLGVQHIMSDYNFGRAL